MFQDTEKVELLFFCPRCGREEARTMELPAGIVEPGRFGGLCEKCAALRAAEEQAERDRYEARQRSEETQVPFEFRSWDPRLGNGRLAGWIRENRDCNLLIVGGFETGKTRAAACNLLIEARGGKRCRFYDFPELSKEYAREMQQSVADAIDFQKRLLALDILLVDDLAKRRINDTAGELMYDLVNKVYEGARTRLWLTSNHDTRELVGKFSNPDTGGAVLSRIDRMADQGRFKIRKGER